MPKSYLRFARDRIGGLIATHAGNVAVSASLGLVCTPCLEGVGVWDLKTGQQVGFVANVWRWRGFPVFLAVRIHS